MSPEIVGAIGMGVNVAPHVLGCAHRGLPCPGRDSGYALIQGVDRALLMAGMTPFPLSPLTPWLFPVYLLMGEFADISGMMRDSFRAANAWVGNCRGGLAMASIIGAASILLPLVVQALLVPPHDPTLLAEPAGA